MVKMDQDNVVGNDADSSIGGGVRLKSVMLGALVLLGSCDESDPEWDSCVAARDLPDYAQDDCRRDRFIGPLGGVELEYEVVPFDVPDGQSYARCQLPETQFVAPVLRTAADLDALREGRSDAVKRSCDDEPVSASYVRDYLSEHPAAEGSYYILAAVSAACWVYPELRGITAGTDGAVRMHLVLADVNAARRWCDHNNALCAAFHPMLVHVTGLAPEQVKVVTETASPACQDIEQTDFGTSNVRPVSRGWHYGPALDPSGYPIPVGD